MGRIQPSFGLVTGIPVADTIDQLLAISARPRDLLVNRTEQLRAQQVAIAELTAQVIGLEFAMQRFGDPEFFQSKQVSSSDDAILSASSSGDPAVGVHQFTPARLAQSHQLLSGGFTTADQALGGGEIALRFGGFLDRAVSLDELNGGAGVQRGQIRVTDRSGAGAIIDLRLAQSVDDVLEAINGNSEINVTATASGDRIVLTDNTGQSVSNLKVQEVGLGSTATELGLAGIDESADTAVGQDVLWLHDQLALDRLNDGNGVALRRGVADLEVTFRDGSPALQIEFLAQSKGPTPATATTDAAAGPNASVTLTTVGSGESQDGYRIIFENNDDVEVGQETAVVDTVNKTLTVQIDAGQTTAADVVRAVNSDDTVSQVFTASAASGGDGTGLVDVTDTATTSGGATAYNNESTLGDLLATINAADPARLEARISATGDSIELIDLTSGSGTFAVSSLSGGTVAEDLGLAAATAVDGVLSGGRRLSGLKTVLLDSLQGGWGFGFLGLLSLTDRNGSTASVDLSAAATLDDVIAAINAADVGIVARINGVRNGLELLDTSGGGGNLVVANGDSTNSADQLGIAVDGVVASVDSGSLDLQTFHEQLRLDSLNQGRGVGTGSFLITDSSGQSGAVNLAAAGAETVGDVINLINGLPIGVQARINDTGDGILLVDTAGGDDPLTVADEGTGTAAADLHIAGSSSITDINGTPTAAIDGSTTLRIVLEETDTLQDLVDKINDQDGNIAVNLFNSGTGTTPFRLSVASQVSGSAGELLIDGAALGVTFQEVAAAQDALMLVGSLDAPVAVAFAVSSSNTFEDLIDGVTMTINEASAEPVTIDISPTEDPIISQLQLFVDQYNRLRTKIDELSFFDEVQNSTGVLFGSTELLRVEFDLANLLSGRIFGAGPIQSIEEIGLSLDPKGQLQFDEQEFRERYAENPDDVQQFFAQAETGLAARFVTQAEQLAGEGNSLLISRSLALNTSIDNNTQRILDLNAALEREREQLFNEFARLETVISQLQADLETISRIQPVPPLVLANNS